MDHNCVTSVGCINADDIVEFGLNLVGDSKGDLLHVLCNVRNIGELDVELGRAETAGADRF